MFYAYLRTLVYNLFWAMNGNIKLNRKEKLLSPDENYVFVAPHRSFLDPIFMGYAARPKQFIFMAKKELFRDRAFGWWIRMCGAFPIDRENPGTDAIRYPVKILKKGTRSLVMFPSGSRHSDDVKGGVAVIAKTAKVKIMPMVIDGPNKFKDIFKSDRLDITFSDPIDVSDIKRMDDEGLAEVSRRIEEAFADAHAYNQTIPDRHKRPHPLTYLYRIPFFLFLLLVLAGTYLFSFIASFFWKPEKHRKD
ncbi:lysophospholipid acyltransferase family protein [Streptococcus sp. DD13]|uniref:lysophospholipid acyltransferase family protein n=1 Tax=Streptococcus sp. DD13 TaxID=1777881 RepID=UPI000792CE6B|nr:1-acyl-sn-glycerol-3-phosphate acyltransferase [Streptococcus sp. DD13]KXT78332.1 1-acyl-sn-glycerol-3-phosphate acyltransferase [Streptococcus sp. DD13]